MFSKLVKWSGEQAKQSSGQAKRVGREVWRQPVVTLLFAVAVIFVIARTALLSAPELFPGGARIGEVLFELAVAYIGAWFFNLLVVVLPRMRSRDLVLTEAGKVIQRLGAIGQGLEENLGVTKDADGQRRFIPPLSMRHIDEESPGFMSAAPGFRRLTWRQLVQTNVSAIQGLSASIVPYFQFFEIELIERVNAVIVSRFVFDGRAFGSLPSSVTMDFLTPSLDGFLDACEELRSYYQREVVAATQGRQNAPSL